ncbi:ArgE/DapE family deacylase [Salicibibacter cibarius]|uniref:Probable succinyl-diaminopimelate desuccinylase n=1 Tax=Salicibibacter cibarius TaxID=2743000 RepID=A0A7T6Z6W8_9BACI|nr:ArgE/DapE family deacylase [Salicibibacter cibarius]QQK77994.1 ArgE/DapE family deacylase [Salicibibacter cibarius]
MEQTKAIDWLKAILRTDTVNPPGNEERVAKQLEALFLECDIQTERVPYSDGRMNLIATLKGDGGSDKVLGLCGHMDVVPTGDRQWSYDPFAADEVDGKIYARGACDMKSGLMACVMAMIQLKEAGVKLAGDVKLLATVGEEVGAVGAKQLVEEGHADDLDALIIAEPTKSEIVVTHKGALWIAITCYGKTAHGSRPHHGVNALMHMNEIMNALLSDRFQMKYRRETLLGEPTFSMNAISAGANTNVVPDSCTLKLDIRSVPSQDHKEIVADIQSIIDEVKESLPDLNADIHVENDLSPMQTAPDHAFVDFLLDFYESETGERKTPRGMSGYTDGSQFMKNKKDFPIVIWSGIQGSTAHQPNEYVDIADYLRTIDLFKAVAQEYLR